MSIQIHVNETITKQRLGKNPGRYQLTMFFQIANVLSNSVFFELVIFICIAQFTPCDTHAFTCKKLFIFDLFSETFTVYLKLLFDLTCLYMHILIYNKHSCSRKHETFLRYCLQL